MNTIYNYQNLKREFPREVVEKLLLEDKYTYKELQEKYNYNERLWSKLAKEYNIPKQMNNIRKNANKYHSVQIDDNLLIELYEEKKYSLRKLADVFNCNKSTIKEHLKKLNIEIRPFNDKNYYINRKTRSASYCNIDSAGYIRNASYRQHRIIMEQFLGRKLTQEECVHHIDFDKTNNDITNLFLFENNDAHLSYHSYIKNNNYIHPQFFLDNIYPQIIYYKSKDFLYEQYVVLNKSVAQINREINNYISRSALTRLLKKYGFFINGKHINQYG